MMVRATISRQTMQIVKKKAKQSRLVVAVISTDYAPNREELRGIASAARRFGWRFETIDNYFIGADWARQSLDILRRADGVIARHYGAIADGTLASLGVPLVGMDMGAGTQDEALHSKSALGNLWASVTCDNRAVAETAARELLATGRRVFTVIPMPKRHIWTRDREKAFLGCIREAGCVARRYNPVTEWDWTAERESLSRWLSRLPRPFGVFAANDRLAKFTLEACQAAGLEVPRDAAIIGADNDETHCLSVRPNLSSVRIDFEGGGRLAAETLERLMDARDRSAVDCGGRDGARPLRKPKRPERLQYGILGVARRASTRVGPVPRVDPRLQDGLDYIARRFGDPHVGIGDVAKAMDVCPRQAERIFAATGKAIRSHIEEARLARIRDLLSTTGAPVGDIAKACGFASDTYFSQFVRARLGCSPTAWRKRNAQPPRDN